MTLDSLYGKGTTAALRKEVGGKIAQADIPEGVRVYLTWSDGEAKIDCTPDSWNWLHLRSEGKGRQQQMVDLNTFARERGVKLWIATPADETAEKVLLGKGEWEKVGGRLEWVLDG